MKTTYYSLYPSRFKLDGGAMFGIIPKPLWNKRIPADEQNRIEMSLRMLVIKHENKIIVIDSGCGDYHGDKFEERFGMKGNIFPIKEMLKAALNISPEEVTDVVATHLHFDHAGGFVAGIDKSLTFPNSILHLHQKHFDYAQHSSPRDAGSFHLETINSTIEQYRKRGKINWLTADGGKIIPGVLDFITVHGHTPYQVLPYNHEMIQLADLVPTTHHVDIPWVMGYDLHPGQTALERKSVYDFIIEKKLMVIFDHDLDTWGARLKDVDGHKYEFTDLKKSNQSMWEKCEITK